MTDVVCVNFGTKYPAEYVRRLYNMVRRNTTGKFKFYVLTDNLADYPEEYINIIPLDHDDEGWWHKIKLFKRGVLPDGEYLYLDLDVVIVDNIDCFFRSPSFGITRDFIRPTNGLLPGPEYNSSVLRFNNTSTQGIYDYYIQNKEHWKNFQKQVHFFGDQNVISAYVNSYPSYLNVFPDEWLWSYKKGVHRGKTAGDRSKMFGKQIPNGGKICVFHGNPNPMEVLDVEWIKENFR
jgi:hypothetical protein